MREATKALCIAVIGWAVGIGPVLAQQPAGPPISADQILRQQSQPIPPIPSPPVPATPPPGPPMPSQVPAPRNDGYSDRVARCRHQAAEERVPRSRRNAYVHNCISN